MNERPKVQIKGIRDGLLITLSDGPWDEIQQGLLAQLDTQADFLRGARLTIDVGNQVLRAVEMSKLRDELSEREFSLWGIISNSPTTEKTAQTLGLATRLPQPRTDLVRPATETRLKDGEEAILVHRTLRSGYRLQHSGHIVLIGDVNPGAEIIAGGDVIVWGRLLGTVHAGANGNNDSIVCALELSPTQLRIAERIVPTTQKRGKRQPEMAQLQNGRLVIETWDAKKRIFNL